MAKKKPVNPEFNTVDMTEAGAVDTSAEGGKTPGGDLQEAPRLAEAEAQVASLSDALARSQDENEKLKAKLAEYVEEARALREKAEAKAEESPEAARLRAEVKRLQDENDKYLMRISELTFELAKAEAQVKNLSAQQAQHAPGPSKTPGRGPAPRGAYEDRYRTNGYTSWN